MTSVAEQKSFDLVLEEVLESLPDEVKEILKELPIIVEDEPSPEILAVMGISARPGEADLCGLHSGVPMSAQSIFDPEATPPAIHLFRGPLYRTSDFEPEELREQIRITLLHEIGHHYGMTEEDLDDLGYS